MPDHRQPLSLQYALLTDDQPTPSINFVELRAHIEQLRSYNVQVENKLRQLHTNRTTMPQAVFMQQARTLQDELVRGKARLDQLVQYCAKHQSQQQHIQRHLGSDQFPGRLPPPLEKHRFEKVFGDFLSCSTFSRDPRTIGIEGRLLDFHALHTAVLSEGGYSSVTQRDLWSVIAGRIGFGRFPGDNVEPPKSGPALARQIGQIYKEFVTPFDSVYVGTLLESSRKVAGSNSEGARALVRSFNALQSERPRGSDVPNIKRNMIGHQAFPPVVAQPGGVMPTSPSASRFKRAAVGETSTSNHEGKEQIQHAIIQHFIHDNPGELSDATSRLNSMKDDILHNRISRLPPVVVPADQRPEYDGVVEALYRSAMELNGRLPLFVWSKTEAWIRQFAAIVVTAQHQRSNLLSSRPHIFVSLHNLRYMLQEVKKAHEGFDNLIQTIGTQRMTRNNNRVPSVSSLGSDQSSSYNEPFPLLDLAYVGPTVQQFARDNQQELARLANLLNNMKYDFLHNRMHHLPLIAVPPEQRAEYDFTLEELYRSTMELDWRLPMLLLWLKNEPWIRKIAIIVVVAHQQRDFFLSSNPRFIISLDNLRHMLQEVQKAHQGFNTAIQGIAAQNVASFNNGPTSPLDASSSFTSRSTVFTGAANSNDGKIKHEEKNEDTALKAWPATPTYGITQLSLAPSRPSYRKFVLNTVFTMATAFFLSAAFTGCILLIVPLTDSKSNW